MASKKTGREEILTSFFDEGAYSTLFADGAVQAAFGSAGGQPVYVVCQNGNAVSVKDVEKNIKVLEMAAETGNPVVTFYDSCGAKLEEGLDALAASAKVTSAVSRISGVVPQVAVVTGVCGATSALAAAAADVCIMSEDAELFFTAPFTSAAAGDKVADAGKAAAGAKAGIVACVVPDALAAAAMAAHVVGLLPANNLAGPSVFEYEAPVAPLNMLKYTAAQAVAAIADKDSAIELYAGYGKHVCTALATVNGNAAGIVATEGALCGNCAAKIARFVRLCDAFSVPVVTVVNSDGFVPSTSEDIAGGMRAAARVTATYADATTAKVAVLAGKAVGPVYTALANADLTVAVNGCVVAPVDPKVAVSVLYKEELDASANILAATEAKAKAYAAEQANATCAVEAGLADMVAAPADVRGCVVAALDMLATKRAARLAKKHGNMAL